MLRHFHFIPSRSGQVRVEIKAPLARVRVLRSFLPTFSRISPGGMAAP